MVGTRLVLKAVQVITLSSNAGVDVGTLDDDKAEIVRQDRRLQGQRTDETQSKDRGLISTVWS